ncbi:FAD-dependent oxidoreductase [Pseudomonas sp. gcc21]|uniref:NAD(P)/FAD-dependent oxidoreductase n=1 Tax=Pseudomonas sp. gcc21 TaxID=2726989 RepID=UPI00145172D8|nr:FAD-dependent oxidoreductase [Pseudomonas sp. gcc21]QJD60838.1 FAD-dependent oxidoreductase [Pseudomonas sp. gcc21]
MRDVLIVGGGVMGCLSALNLVNAGMSVTLIERGRTGREASWAGGGIVSPLYPWRYSEAISALAQWSQHYYPELGRMLAAETGIDPEVTPCGLMWLDHEEQEQALAWAARHRSPLQQRDAAFVYERVPQLASGFRGALWHEGLANVRNPRLMAALKAWLTQQPAFTLLENTEVSGLLEENGRVNGVRHAAGENRAGAVVVAAGAWTGDWLGDIGLDLPVAPVKGEMLLYKREPGWLSTMVLYQGRYAIPRRDGHILVGSTLEHVGYDKQATDQAFSSLRDSAIRMLPELADEQPVGHWAGLRPGSPEGVPFIGQVPERQGLWINAGHYRNGLVLAPASCRLLADLMTGARPAINPSPYALEGRLSAAS